MKNLFIIILSIVLLSLTPANTFAGFTIKKTATITERGATVTNMPIHNPALTKKEQRCETVKSIKNLVSSHYAHPRGKGSSSGWEGIVALVCGILGLVTGWLAIPAIIFGAIGMGRGHAHRGMALAGFIMGVVVIAIAIVLIALVVALGGF